MKSQCLPSDIISTLPQNIIEMILTFMPIQDAVRTSVLSRKWRCNWVKISKLVFDQNLFNCSTSTRMEAKRGKIFYAINHVLLLHQGPILEFTFDLPGLRSCFEIDLIILLLSRNATLKKFTLTAYNYKLPSTFFSLQQLTHLDLRNCELESPLTFNGFNMLTSLSLSRVKVTDKVLLRLLSGCPILKRFTMFASNSKLAFQEECSIVQLLKCFSVIEYLDFDLYPILRSFTERIPRKLARSLVHLKHLDLSGCCLMGEHEFSFTLLLIRSSPNLEKLKIEIKEGVEDIMNHDTVFLVLQDYADVRLNHLTNFEIISYSYDIAELELVKLILVKSPMLKKMHIRLAYAGCEREEIKMLRSLISLPCASPVEIIIR